jgi:hypothetical protein
MTDDRSLRLLLAAILLNRHQLRSIAPHHVSALRERLGYPSDEELQEWIRTGHVPQETPSD